MATGVTLKTDDAIDVLEELLEAQNHSYVFGLKLKLPLYVVEAIHSTYLQPRERLLHVLIEFLKQRDLLPTWRVIADALATRSVNLFHLAEKVEAAHFPNAASTRELSQTTASSSATVLVPTPIPPPNQQTSTPPSATLVQMPTTSQQHTPTITRTCIFGTSSEGAASLDCRLMTSQEVQGEIDRFDRRFNDLKNRIRACLEKNRVAVQLVADVLTSLPADDVDEHKQFLETHVSALFKAVNHSELFGTMNFHWNYLNYPLLDHLIRKFELEEVKSEMEGYKVDLQQFREKTPLTLFCKTQKKRRIKPSQEFQEVVAEFDWPEDVTLEVVEQFRQEYACHYSLRECAMMLAVVRPGSFIITWFIPESIVEKLKAKIPRGIIKKYTVTKLEVAGVCVYRLRKPQVLIPTSSGDGHSGGGSAASTQVATPGATPVVSEALPSAAQDYLFVEQPSDDFFCPVTYGLLLQPHLTSCCGKHLSEEAACRIRREGGACPLCNMACWSTMLNKHFQRQVNELVVFCLHDDRGCGWQGELSDLERHVQSCPMSDAPLMEDLLELDIYSGRESSASEHISAQLIVQCHVKRNAPCVMCRGSATTDNQCAYFTPDDSNAVYKYTHDICGVDKWVQLPPCPYRNSALVFIEGSLTAVGGRNKYHSTEKLFTLQQKQWVEEYPPMNTPRSDAAVVSTPDGDIIVAIGGLRGGHVGGDCWVTIVELFKVRSRRWYELTDAPPIINPSATLCSNHIYVIGDDYYGYSCSIKASDKHPRVDLGSWTSLPLLPVTRSTATTLCGQLVIIGGRQHGSPINSIHQLVDGKWVEIASMSHGRQWCLVASTATDKIVVVGGYGAPDKVEECIQYGQLSEC